MPKHTMRKPKGAKKLKVRTVAKKPRETAVAKKPKKQVLGQISTRDIQLPAHTVSQLPRRLVATDEATGRVLNPGAPIQMPMRGLAGSETSNVLNPVDFCRYLAFKVAGGR